MGRANVTWEQLAQGVSVPADEQHKLVIERNYADVIEVGERELAAGSSVLMPLSTAPAEERELLALSGLSVIAHALRYAKAHSDRKLAVLAHDDDRDVGRAMVCSERRAQNIHAVLTGDHAAFAASCFYAGSETAATLLRWAAMRFNYACKPDAGSSLEQAVRGFRASHNARTGTKLAGKGPLGNADLEAFASLYDEAIAKLLEVEPSDLAGFRSSLVFCDPPWLGCGNRWAAPSGADAHELRSGSQRRVDLTFFESSIAIPDLSIKPNGAYVFADQRRARCIYVRPEPPPAVTCVRMQGLYFDSNKCFLLPSALSALRVLVGLYTEYAKGELLIVGHTDTAGRPAYNDTLSLERAKAVAAFLKDDVDTWLAWYGDDKPPLKRWGKTEDLAMLGALPDGATHLAAPNRIKSYQASRGLADDGICGNDTRKQLITDYMALDATSLPAGLAHVAHGCGESFPAVATGDEVEQDENRRVELFLFDDGIDPKPSGEISKPGSPEYAAWREQVVREEVFDPEGESGLRIAVEIPCRDGSDPVDNARYRLRFGEEEIEGRTDARGFLSLPCPEAREGVLEVWVDGDDQPAIEWDLTIEDLPEMDQLEGARIRLANLGLFDEEEGGSHAFAAEDEALLAFQVWRGVSDADPFGEPTQSALRTYVA